MKNLLKSYNTDTTVLVITSYPNPENGKFGKRDFNAIGEHSERRLPYLAQQGKILVAAEKSGKTTTFEAKENLLIHRMWEKGNYASFWHLFLFLLSNYKIKSVFVQFEFNVFGGIIPNLLVVAMLAIMRLLGKKVTFELHQVIMDIGTLYKHVPIKTRALQLIFNVCLRIFYFVLGVVCTHIIVFEEDLKLRLKTYVAESKIHVLCLSIVKKTLPQKAAARRKLQVSQKDFVVMQFGFINGYKGIDWAIQALSDVNKTNKGQKIRYLLVGGPNPYLKHESYYKRFYRSIVTGMQKHTHMTHIGFIPEEDIKLAYAAADIVLMPYEVFMSASGPFSQAIAHGKPILLSEALQLYGRSTDFRAAMQQAGIYKNDLFFPFEKKKLHLMLKKAQTNKTYLKRLETFSISLREKRSSVNIMRHLYSIIVPEESLVSTYLPKLMVQS